MQLTPEGQLRTAWPRCYALKPAKAVEFDRFYAPRIQATYGSNAAYTDVHTAVAPWRYCDFDHRVPGAGTFAQTIYLYGEILLHDRGVYGPTWSEGTYHWLYAGLASGNYGLCYSGPNLSTFPLLPVFDLREIHPRECDIGMPWTAGFFRGGPWAKPDRLEHSIDRFIATTIAYGHIGWLVEEGHGIRRTCRSYYMIQPAQRAYAQANPSTIEYADAAGSMQSVSDALRSGVWRDSRLLVRYANGVSVRVNGGDSLWIVPPGRGTRNRFYGGPWLLPAAGYLVEGEDLLVFSGMYGGVRVDVAVNEEVVYADSRGAFLSYPFGLACGGGVAVRRTGPRELEVIDCGGNDWIGLGGAWDPIMGAGTPQLLGSRCVIRKAAAFSETGEDLGAAEIRAGDGCGYVKVKKGAVRYVVTVAMVKSAAVIGGVDKPAVPAGETLSMTVVCAPDSPGVRAAVHGPKQKREKEIIPEGKRQVAFDFPVGPEVTQPLWLEVRLKERTIWKRLAVKPSLVATPLKKEVVPATEALAFVVERFGARPFRARKPAWLDVTARELDGLTRLDYALGDRSSAAVPSEGEILGIRFTVTEREAVLHDLLSPSIPLRWSIKLRGAEAVPGRTESGATCQRTERACGGIKKPCLFTHPPYHGGVGATIADLGPLELQAEPSSLAVSFGIADGGDVSDGVVFSVYAAETPGTWQHVATKRVKRPGWTAVTADLAPFAGKTVYLRLLADVGPENNSNSDWACWGEPKIVGAKKRTTIRFQ